MSILDKATNDALNAVINLHAETKDGRCGHCYDVGFDQHREYPCPTITAMLGACQPIMAARKGN